MWACESEIGLPSSDKTLKYLLKRDRKGSKTSNPKKRLPKSWAGTSVSDGISLATTTKYTPLEFSSKTGASAPVIRNCTDVREG